MTTNGVKPVTGLLPKTARVLTRYAGLESALTPWLKPVPEKKLDPAEAQLYSSYDSPNGKS